jgi:hypothetical protein
LNYEKLYKSPTLRENKVKYHSSYGNPAYGAWQDRSKGLPEVPITRLLYAEGSDDVLFAATDIGVYRWNKSAGRWECFNNGLPRGVVADMEINYCNGKLRVSLYGRGIWETDYRADLAYYAPSGSGINEITSNTTINQNRSFNTSIRVKAGATLTITGANTKIYMPRNGRIIVEPNAKLIIDGATLTNECGYAWYGIEVAGNNNQDPILPYQGYCEIRNGALIENAVEGLHNYCSEYGFQGGGILKVSNSTFRNCFRAVGLNGYNSKSYYYNGVSQCKFEKTNFIYDEGTYPKPEALFTSWNTGNGVEIFNCNFTSNLSPFNPYPTGAIHGDQLGFWIKGCTFTNFNRAINVYGNNYGGTLSTRIHNNTFNDNKEAIMLYSSDLVDIKSNNFYISPLKGSTAITLYNARKSSIGCGNNFTGQYMYPNTISSIPNYGIISDNDNRKHIIWGSTNIFSNTFKNIPIAFQTQNWNDVILNCNNFNNNYYGWVINPQSISSGKFSNQGTTAQNAGNKFYSNVLDIRSYINSLNTPFWNYYYGTSTNDNPNVVGTVNKYLNNKTTVCVTSIPCISTTPGSSTGTFKTLYTNLVAEGKRYEPEGRSIYNQLIMSYNEVEDTTNLISFLELEQDTESDKLLIGHYVRTRNYSKALNKLSNIQVNLDEKNALLKYYNIINTLQEENRLQDTLSALEIDVLRDLAKDSFEVSNFAKTWLEHYKLDSIIHHIEEIPVGLMSGKFELPQVDESEMYDAVPNPAQLNTDIYIAITAADAAYNPKIVVRNAVGHTLLQTDILREGKQTRSLDLSSLNSGVYFYSLIRKDGSVIKTKKLVINK